jgi:anti-anti-sigma factor
VATGFDPHPADDASTYSDPGTPITIRVSTTDHEPTVTAAGELDFTNAHRLVETVAGIELDGHRTVVLDLSGLTFCDARGVSALLEAHNEIRSAGRALRLRGVAGVPRRILRITGAESCLDVE